MRKFLDKMDIYLGTSGGLIISIILSSIVIGGCALFPPTAYYKDKKVTSEELQVLVNKDIADLEKQLDSVLADLDSTEQAGLDTMEAIKKKAEERKALLGGFSSLLSLAGVPLPVTETLLSFTLAGATADNLRVRRRAKKAEGRSA